MEASDTRGLWALASDKEKRLALYRLQRFDELLDGLICNVLDVF